MSEKMKHKKTGDLASKIIIFSGMFSFLSSSSTINALGFVIFTVVFLVLLYSEKSRAGNCW